MRGVSYLTLDLTLLVIALFALTCTTELAGQRSISDPATANIFTVKGQHTFLNGKEFMCIGLRCSNALMSDETTEDLIDHLDLYQRYGVNTISVFFMGSRFGDVQGYRRDGSIHPIYAKRMAKIIEACDDRGMVVLVGCLYWGNSKGKYEEWTSNEASLAIANTISWLSDHQYRNVFVDPDNEAMAQRSKGFKIEELIAVAKDIDSTIVVGFNAKSVPPAQADLGLHFAEKKAGICYIQSEGTPSGYWGAYSKEEGLYQYINVGIYTEGKKLEQLGDTDRHLQHGMGYIFASTWLQNIPPNCDPGGDGTPCHPGILWWLEHVRANY